MGKKAGEGAHFNKYYSIRITDVAGLLPFVKKEERELAGEIKEDARVKEELTKFTSILKRHYHQSIIYIGEEKRFGKHLERFLVDHNGFMEIMIEPPLIMNIESIHRATAEKFLVALKKTFYEIIKHDNVVKRTFIEGIVVEEGNKYPLTIEKWEKMHTIAIRKTVVYTLVAIFIALTFSIFSESFEIIAGRFFGYKGEVIKVAMALVIAFAFGPIKHMTDEFVAKHMKYL